MTEEALIDAGLATPEMIVRQDTRDREREARWRALPWRIRMARRYVWPRWHEAERRLGHAARALRGIECEGDD